MRILLITRGLPGSGKSTWIREHGLEPYTISTDKLRLMFSAPVMSTGGETGISQKVNRLVFECLDEMLENRISRGDFTVIDACHVKTMDYTKYRHIAKERRYRVIMTDFSDVPLEECLRRNRERDALLRVAERDILKMHRSLLKCEVPNCIRIFSHNEDIII